MNTQATDMIDNAIRQAEAIGKRHGENAAEFAAQYMWGGRHSGDSEAAAREFFRLAEAGDPALYDSYQPPNLSGEFADDYSAADLMRDVLDGYDKNAGELIEPEELDDIADAYTNAARDGFWQRLEETAAQVLER